MGVGFFLLALGLIFRADARKKMLGVFFVFFGVFWCFCCFGGVIFFFASAKFFLVFFSAGP